MHNQIFAVFVCIFWNLQQNYFTFQHYPYIWSSCTVETPYVERRKIFLPNPPFPLYIPTKIVYNRDIYIIPEVYHHAKPQI